MKTRKRKILRKIMAVLLSMVLIVAITQGVAPINVLAKENVGRSEEEEMMIPKLPLSDEEISEKIAQAEAVVISALGSYTATNDSSEEEIQAAVDAEISAAGITDVTVMVGELTKTDATKEQEGSISGEVSIECGSKTETVTINKIIAKLPLSEEDKVEAAKSVVEGVLGSYTATNDSSKNEIQEAVDAAISATGITDVTVTVGELTKTDATKEQEGSISGEVSIECGSKTETVTINKIIAKLPLSEEDKVETAVEVVHEVLDSYTTTNDSSEEEIQAAVDAALSDADITDVTVTVSEFAKMKASIHTEGVIRFRILYKCGNASTLNTYLIPIDKLPLSDKVEVAVEVVHEVLDSYTAANDSSEEEIQAAVDAALSDADITDVTVTISEFVKIKASIHTKGIIRFRILYKCGNENTSCSYLMPIAKLPLSEEGTITTDIKEDGKAPATKLFTSVKELEDMLLTDAEKQQVANGMDVNIVLDVKDVSDSIGSGDKAKVQTVLNDYMVGQYIDISLYKLIGENRTDIMETSKKLTITVSVPDSLKNTDGKVIREFAVVRVHDGNADILSDLDENDDTITITTDRFSTYAIIYKDISNGGNDGNNDGSNNNDKNGNQNKTDQSPDTADNTPIKFVATLAMISGFTYLLLLFSDRKRGMTEETKKELVSQLIEWAKRGGKIRKLLALVTIFVLLLYYHSIGKKTDVEWQEVYAK